VLCLSGRKCIQKGPQSKLIACDHPDICQGFLQAAGYMVSNMMFMKLKCHQNQNVMLCRRFNRYHELGQYAMGEFWSQGLSCTTQQTA